MKTIIGISGSVGEESSNSRIIDFISSFSGDGVQFFIYKDLSRLPHFNPDLEPEEVPREVLQFRKMIENADGIIISTPEYVFSIPSILKNALEWTVSTTVFMNKPVALITASSSGKVGHESLIHIVKTLSSNVSEDHCLLISGVKSKIKKSINDSDPQTINKIKELTNAFVKSLEK